MLVNTEYNVPTTVRQNDPSMSIKYMAESLGSNMKLGNAIPI